MNDETLTSVDNAQDEAARLAVEQDVDTQTLLEQQAQELNNNQETQAQELAQNFNLDPDAIGEHWLEHGKAPDDVVEKLSTVGVSREMVEDFIALRYERFQKEQNSYIEEIGGQEQWGQIQNWAATNWSQAQINAYNEMAESGDKGKIQIAITALKSAYQAANPPAAQKPALVKATGAGVAQGGIVPYLSRAAAQRDIANPLYKSDPTFRSMVEQRIMVSRY